MDNYKKMYNDKTSREDRLCVKDFNLFQTVIITALIFGFVLVAILYAPQQPEKMSMEQINYCQRLLALQENNPTTFVWEQYEWDSCVNLNKIK